MAKICRKIFMNDVQKTFAQSRNHRHFRCFEFESCARRRPDDVTSVTDAPRATSVCHRQSVRG